MPPAIRVAEQLCASDPYGRFSVQIKRTRQKKSYIVNFWLFIS